MREFSFAALPWNVVFGVGALERLPELLEGRGLARALVLATPEQAADADKVAAVLAGRAAGRFTGARMHVPRATVDAAAAEAQRVAADCTVSIGGGSTTGLGKALKLEQGLPHIAIPTTYAGSEMTNIWAITDGDRKTTGRDPRIVPDIALYDPALTLSLPARVAGPSGINALAQATVNVMAAQDNPIVTCMAVEAIRALAASLPRVISTPTDLEARAEALYGACLAGAALGTGTLGIHHRLCHALGGTFNTPHAETHTILLPHTVAFNAPGVPEAAARVAQALGAADAAAGIFDLITAIGAPTALSSLGIKEEDLPVAAAIALEVSFSNPVPVTVDNVTELLRRAWSGRRPG
jgi:maleylacetate reductase